MTISERIEPSHVSPECFHAYVSAEIKIPNTLTAVGPYVGHAALKLLQKETDLRTGVKNFANSYAFSGDQMGYAIKAVMSLHGKFGVPVLPEGADLTGKTGTRVFKQERFEVVYMEGVKNILKAILCLYGIDSQKDDSCEAQVAELLEHPDNLATLIAVFAAAENAIQTAESTDKSEAFKEQFNFIRTGEKPRAMTPAEKEAVQTAVMPMIIAEVRKVLVEKKMNISEAQLEKFVYVLTSPELYQEATAAL